MKGKSQVNSSIEKKELEIEHRHSDYGPDAGGYAVLWFDKVWIGRIDDQDKAKELLEYVTQLEKALSIVEHALSYVMFKHRYSPEDVGRFAALSKTLLEEEKSSEEKRDSV